MPPLTLLVGSDKAWPADEYKQRKPDGFPSKLRGVYLLSDTNEHLLYVGLAMWNFDKRVWSHDAHFDRRCIDIIAFVDPWYVLAPALEFYLIQELKPPQNTTYSGYGVAACEDHPIPSAPKLPNG